MLRPVEVEDALRRCGGAARQSRLIALGVTRHALRTAVRAGRIEAPAVGAYALADADPAFVAAASLSGVVSHASAARLHGLDLLNMPRTVEVTVGRGCRQTTSGVQVYSTALPSEDVEINQPVTTIRRTVRDCARTMPMVEAVVLLDGVVRNGHLTVADLRIMAKSATGPGSTALRRAVGYVDAMAGSVLESLLRLWVELLAVEYETQVSIPGVGDVDILVEGWLVLEGDGFAFHSDRAAYRKDRRRGNSLVIGRYVLLRFTYEEVRYRPSSVLRQILAALATRPGRKAADGYSREA